MKKMILALAATTMLAGAALTSASLAGSHGPVKIGVILGFTGPIESLTPHMAASAEVAIKEVSDSGKFLGGKKVEAVRADSTCVDSAAATTAAERLITSDKVAAIMGADCSGVTGAVLKNVALATGTVMVSPSATSPGLSTAEDNGLFFRTAPSDARQGEVLANVLIDKGIKNVAVTYTNNDYGKGFADAFSAAYEEAGGKITLTASHEDGKGDYGAEIGALAAAGGDALVVLGYADQGGKGIIQGALDAGAFSQFAIGDGMISESLIENIGEDLAGTIGTLPGSEGEGKEKFKALAAGAVEKTDSPYTGESYDAAALILLAMQKGGEASSAAAKEHLMAIANAPGEKILPGELGKALEILASGGDIDYVGATNVELIGPGEAGGTYKELLVKGGKFETVKTH